MNRQRSKARSEEKQAAADSFPETYLGYLLARAAYMVTSEFHDQLEQSGVSVSTWRILTAVMDRDRIISEVGELVLMKQPTLSKALDRLERDKLVSRKRVGSERRVIYVSATPAGRKLALTLRKAAETHEKSLRAVMPEGQAQDLKSLLTRLVKLLASRG